MIKFDWHIAGNGATGQVLAFMLRQAGYTVCLLSHKPQHSEITLQYNQQNQPPTTWKCPIFYYKDNFDIKIDKLIITTKAHAAQQAIKQWQDKMSTDTRLYFWQNGIGFIDEKILQQQYFYVVNNGIASFKTAYNKVTHTAHCDVMIGSTNTLEANNVDLEQLQHAGINCIWTANINAQRWLKVAINAIINPLSVIYKCNNGQLAKIPSAVQQIKSLSDECARVFDAHKIKHTAEEIYNITHGVINKTKNNLSSMLQDYNHGNTTSEIAYINDQIIKLAAKYNIPVPTHILISEKIKHIFNNNL